MNQLFAYIYPYTPFSLPPSQHPHLSSYHKLSILGPSRAHWSVQSVPTSNLFYRLPWRLRRIKNLLAMQKTWVQSLSWEDPLEKGTATCSSLLAWRIPWTKESVGYSPWGHKESDMMVLCICPSQPPNPSHPLLPPLCTQVCSPYLHLYSCPANRFISSIFIDSKYMR